MVLVRLRTLSDMHQLMRYLLIQAAKAPKMSRVLSPSSLSMLSYENILKFDKLTTTNSEYSSGFGPGWLRGWTIFQARVSLAESVAWLAFSSRYRCEDVQHKRAQATLTRCQKKRSMVIPFQPPKSGALMRFATSSTCRPQPCRPLVSLEVWTSSEGYAAMLCFEMRESAKWLCPSFDSMHISTQVDTMLQLSS